MRTRDAIRLLSRYGAFPRRKRRWQPTSRWYNAMMENLARAPRKHSPEKTWQIKQAVRDWLALPEAQRPTQEALADTWGVSKQRINRLVHTLPPSVPFDQTDRMASSGVIPAHIAARDAFLHSTVPPTPQGEPALPSPAAQPYQPAAIYQPSAGLRPDQLVLFRGCPVVDQLP